MICLAPADLLDLGLFLFMLFLLVGFRVALGSPMGSEWVEAHIAHGTRS